MRLVGYVRVSSESQLDGWGPDAQRTALRDWAKANGHRIVHWCEDLGVSGTLDAADRPGLTEALGLIRRPPQADGLLMLDLTRFARLLTVQEACLGLVWDEGGRVFTVEGGEVLHDDPEDPMRTAMRQMRGVLSQLDRATVVKRMRDGRKAKAAAGRKATGSYAYGSKATGEGRERDAGPDELEQVVVQEIVRRRTAGESYRVIAAALDEQGMRPRRATSWSAMSVRNVAQRAGIA